MSLFKEIPPAAGFPLYAKDFFSLLAPEKRIPLEEDFKAYLDVPYAEVTYSGTAAFYFILESLKNISPKKTVIIPAYICPLVPLAIHKAGLKVKVCDINKDNFNFAITELERACSENNDILAIVAVHLGGIPLDLSRLKQIADKNKIFIIEDCAQSLGAEYKEKKVGTQGDFSFFSLCRGKGLTIYEGGVIVTKEKKHSENIAATIKRLAKNDFFSESLKVLELFGYWIVYRPSLFWFAYRLPQIFWEMRGQHLKAVTEYFTIDFATHNVSNIRKYLGHIGFLRLEEEINKQRQKATFYIEELENTEGLHLITEPLGDKANYPYLTLVFSTPEKRKKAFEILKNSGLGVSQIYACPITGYSYLKDIIPDTPCPNAWHLSERELTLSTSTYLKPVEMYLALNVIKGL